MGDMNEPLTQPPSTPIGDRVRATHRANFRRMYAEALGNPPTGVKAFDSLRHTDALTWLMGLALVKANNR